jgi:Dimerisation domain
MAHITPDPIMRIAMGFMAAKHLFVANEIGLFIGLAQGPATLHELVAICGIPQRTAGISADAMVSLGLLERDGDRYRNSDTAAAFLAGQPWPRPPADAALLEPHQLPGLARSGGCGESRRRTGEVRRV